MAKATARRRSQASPLDIGRIPTDSSGVKCAEEIMVLLSQEPHTNEALRRALARKGFYASNDTVRKVCMQAHERGEVKKTSIVTKKHRNGIAIWSRVDESPEKIQACIDVLKSLKDSGFRIAR